MINGQNYESEFGFDQFNNNDGQNMEMDDSYNQINNYADNSLGKIRGQQSNTGRAYTN